MERLTSKCDIEGFENYIYVRGKAYGRAYFESEEDYKNITEALEKLAAYEDTEREPEEIESMSEVTPKEKYLIDNKADNIIKNIEALLKQGELSEKYKHYEEAENEGRLFILPCKVGDTVYLIPTYNGRPYCGIVEDTIQMIGITSRGVHIKACLHHDHNKMYMLNKRAFFSHEEAEKALEGGAK